MSIKFNPMERKRISIDAVIENTDPHVLKYNFVISINEVEYGFNGKYTNGKIVFDIPPLAEVMKTIKGKSFDSKMVVNDGEKFFAKPWAGISEIETAPIIDFKMDNKIEEKETKIEISSINEEIDIDNKKTIVEEKKEKKNFSKFGKSLIDKEGEENAKTK